MKQGCCQFFFHQNNKFHPFAAEYETSYICINQLVLLIIYLYIDLNLPDAFIESSAKTNYAEQDTLLW